jgi:hypothetical protein
MSAVRNSVPRGSSRWFALDSAAGRLTPAERAERGNGYRSGLRRKVVTATVGRYREAMRVFAGQGNLAVWSTIAATCS